MTKKSTFILDTNTRKRGRDSHTRKGLRVIGHKGNREVRSCLIKFARWLRKNYTFPLPVNVYLSPQPFVVASDNEKCCALFFAPFDRTKTIKITIATGDYIDIRKEMSRTDALAAYIYSFAHEIVHYFQWIETGDITEKGVYQKAMATLRKYAKVVKHPL